MMIKSYWIAILVVAISVVRVPAQNELAVEVERKIDAIIAKMSIEEKIGQTALRGTSSRTKVLPEELKDAVRAWQSSLGNNSHYLDAGFTPHFPFGYGLSYTTFKYDNLQLSKNKISKQETITVSFELSPSVLSFVNDTGKRVLEAGDFEVWVAPNAANGLKDSFELTE